jgi:hypothetical protein
MIKVITSMAQNFNATKRLPAQRVVFICHWLSKFNENLKNL